MSTNAVSSTTTIATQAVRQQPDSTEVRAQGAGSTGNTNSASNNRTEVKAQETQKVEEPKPAVNTSGQTIGTTVNTTA